MKRIFSLLAAAGLILTSAAGASAIDFKAGGSFEMGYQWANHPTFTDGEYDRYEAATRVNLRFDAIANENLRGVYQARVGTTLWGYQGTGSGGNSGWGIGSQGVNVKTLDAYLNFRWPDTNLNLKMGMFKVSTPQAVKGKYSDPTVLGERVAGLEASYVFNKNLAATFNWMRTANGTSGAVGNTRDTKMDLLMLAVPVKSDFLNITPWGMYGWVGKNARPGGTLTTANIDTNTFNTAFRPTSPTGTAYYGANGKIWWTGLAMDVKALGNVILKGDVIYGHYKAGSTSTYDKARRAGWYGDVQVGYKMDNMTPLLTFWYASGDKNSDLNGNGSHDSGRMPVLSTASGLTSLGGRNNLAGTQFGARDRMNAQGYTGMWGLIAGLEDIKFVDKLTSAFRVAYMRGTNGKDTINNDSVNKNSVKPWYLAKNDSAWEFNLDNEYKLYKELGLWVDLGYIYLDRNKSNRGTNYENNDVRIFTGFYYNF